MSRLFLRESYPVDSWVWRAWRERNVFILLGVVYAEGLEKAARLFSLPCGLTCSGGLLKMLICSFYIQKLFCCLRWWSSALLFQIWWPSGGKASIYPPLVHPRSLPPQPPGWGLHWLLLHLPLHSLHYVNQTGEYTFPGAGKAHPHPGRGVLHIKSLICLWFLCLHSCASYSKQFWVGSLKQSLSWTGLEDLAGDVHQGSRTELAEMDSWLVW